MKKTEIREVEVKYCDICGEELTHANRCRVCGRDLCPNKCTVFSIEIYQYAENYSDSKRYKGHICKHCDYLVNPIVKAIENSDLAVVATKGIIQCPNT